MARALTAGRTVIIDVRTDPAIRAPASEVNRWLISGMRRRASQQEASISEPSLNSRLKPRVRLWLLVVRTPQMGYLTLSSARLDGSVICGGFFFFFGGGVGFRWGCVLEEGFRRGRW